LLIVTGDARLAAPVADASASGLPARTPYSIFCTPDNTWMTEYIGLAVAARRAQGIHVDDEVLAHISPARSEPVHLFGSIPIDVDKELAKLDAAGYRPLRQPQSR
jgi:hypothetical protein